MRMFNYIIISPELANEYDIGTDCVFVLTGHNERILPDVRTATKTIPM